MKKKNPAWNREKPAIIGKTDTILKGKEDEPVRLRIFIVRGFNKSVSSGLIINDMTTPSGLIINDMTSSSGLIINDMTGSSGLIINDMTTTFHTFAVHATDPVPPKCFHFNLH
jgi:hypothetical protein